MIVAARSPVPSTPHASVLGRKKMDDRLISGRPPIHGHQTMGILKMFLTPPHGAGQKGEAALLNVLVKEMGKKKAQVVLAAIIPNGSNHLTSGLNLVL